MQKKRATVVIAEKPQLDAAGKVIYARGGSDAHLRLSVLLAGLSDARKDSKERAMSPRTSWPDRSREALRCAASIDELTVVDLDAMWASVPGDGPRFDDALSSRERASFFEDLLTLGCERGWRFVRVTCRNEVSTALEDKGLDPLPRRSRQRVSKDDLPPALSPALRPVARWLTQSGRVPAGFSQRTLAASEDVDATLVEAFTDAVGPDARGALRRLSLLREDHTWNGTAGPFLVDSQAPLSVSRGALDRLVEAGAVHVSGPAPGPRRFTVPSVLRDRVASRHVLVEPDASQETRVAISRSLKSGTSMAERLEAHRQAVLAGDLPLATETADLYGSDLRILARAKSQRAQDRSLSDGSRRSGFAEAAEVYRLIVNDYDDLDAYAWQYYAFNLQHAHLPGRGRWTAPSEVTDAVLQAYKRSCELSDKTGYNALFHGRHLAFELLIGTPFTNVYPRIKRQLDHTIKRYGTDQCGWLVLTMKQALKGKKTPRHGDGWGHLLADYPFVGGLKNPPRDLSSATQELEV